MSLFKSASTVSLLTLLSRVTGLVRDLLMATMFGASALTDAFNVAFRIPNLFRRLFAEGAFSQAFVPVLAAARTQHGEAVTHTLIDRVATLLFWVLIAFSVFGVLVAPWLVWLLASGLDRHDDVFASATLMTRMMFPYIACMSLVALSAGILNTWRRYALPAFTPVFLNLTMIVAAIFLAPWLSRHGIEPIYAMAVGVMVGGLVQLGIQIPALKRLGLLPRIGLRPSSLRQAWDDSGVRRILTLMAPAILGVGVAQISLLINTQIASWLQAGSVTWLFYADRLMEFPTALLGVAMSVVLTPQLASAKASGDGQRYSDMLDWGLRMVFIFALPCAVGLVLFAMPLVASLFHYGKLTGHDVHQISVALMGYGAGLLGLVAIKVLAPGFYASQDTRTPVKIAIAVLVITQILNAVMVPYIGHTGLALSIGLGALINASWLLIGLIKRGAYRPTHGWWRLGFQVLAGLIALALFLVWALQSQDWIGLQQSPWVRIGWLALYLAAAIVIYFSTLLAVRVDIRGLLRR